MKDEGRQQVCSWFIPELRSPISAAGDGVAHNALPLIRHGRE
jgi:hypothetical protein